MSILFSVFLLLSIWLIARRLETKEWNKGICKKSGLPWVAFCTDSSGATGYLDGDGNTMWR